MTGQAERPGVPGCVVRLTGPALDDLRTLFAADPQIVRWALKKMIHIEHDPQAGEPLLGGLVGYRKLTFGDRDWRVVWRVARDEGAGFSVDIAHVWAVGYRKDNEVYAEIESRVRRAEPSQRSTALTEVLEMFGKQARGLSAKPEPSIPEPVPRWLAEALLYVVRVPKAQIDRMTLVEAERVWLEHIASADG